MEIEKSYFICIEGKSIILFAFDLSLWSVVDFALCSPFYFHSILYLPRLAGQQRVICQSQGVRDRRAAGSFIVSPLLFTTTTTAMTTTRTTTTTTTTTTKTATKATTITTAAISKQQQ